MSSSRLWRRVAFEMAVRLHENTCYRCGFVITESEDFSMEHKTPHRGDLSLRDDLTNLAWSHLQCNQTHGGKLGGKAGWSIERRHAQAERLRALNVSGRTGKKKNLV